MTFDFKKNIKIYKKTKTLYMDKRTKNVKKKNEGPK
jgi:hypothetical protein